MSFSLKSGDIGFDAVTQWDDMVFGNVSNSDGDHKPGPVFLKLAKLLFDDALSGNTSNHEEILYN